MDEFDELGTYDGNAVHDMYVDYDYQINTNEDIDSFIDNLDDWD